MPASPAPRGSGGCGRLRGQLMPVEQPKPRSSSGAGGSPQRAQQRGQRRAESTPALPREAPRQASGRVPGRQCPSVPFTQAGTLPERTTRDPTHRRRGSVGAPPQPRSRLVPCLRLGRALRVASEAGDPSSRDAGTNTEETAAAREATLPGLQHTSEHASCEWKLQSAVASRGAPRRP